MNWILESWQNVSIYSGKIDLLVSFIPTDDNCPEKKELSKNWSFDQSTGSIATSLKDEVVGQ